VDKFPLMLRIAHGMIAVFLNNQLFGFAGQIVYLAGMIKRHDIIGLAVKNQDMA